MSKLALGMTPEEAAKNAHPLTPSTPIYYDFNYGIIFLGLGFIVLLIIFFIWIRTKK